MHCGNNVSGTRANPKYLLPFLSLFFMGNQNPATHMMYDIIICDTPSTTCVHVKLLHHLWILVIVVEAAQHGGPPLQQGDLPALPGHRGAASCHPSGYRNSFKEMMNIMYNYIMVSLIPLPSYLGHFGEQILNRSNSPCLQYVL